MKSIIYRADDINSHYLASIYAKIDELIDAVNEMRDK
jgi:hypothetical protein